MICRKDYSFHSAIIKPKKAGYCEKLLIFSSKEHNRFTLEAQIRGTACYKQGSTK